MRLRCERQIGLHQLIRLYDYNNIIYPSPETSLFPLSWLGLDCGPNNVSMHAQCQRTAKGR